MPHFLERCNGRFPGSVVVIDGLGKFGIHLIGQQFFAAKTVDQLFEFIQFRFELSAPAFQPTADSWRVNFVDGFEALDQEFVILRSLRRRIFSLEESSFFN